MDKCILCGERAAYLDYVDEVNRKAYYKCEYCGESHEKYCYGKMPSRRRIIAHNAIRNILEMLKDDD